MPSQPIHFSGGQAMSQHTPAEKFVRRSSILLIALFAVAVLSFKTIHQTAHAQTAGGTRLLRTPTVSATQIGFAYAQNIWTVPRAGGMARRITTFQGQTSNPHFSPDGKWIAFSGEYAGNLDVYVVAADGGEPKRLTWHPGADTVQGWTPDGRSIMFSSTRATWSPSGAPRFWTVPVEGGVEQPMALPRGFQGKISADGSHLAYRMNNSWDDERRN
jgi:tricorn protease